MQKYTISEVRNLLGVTRSTMDKILRDGTIGTVTIGRRRYISHDQYEDYLRDIVSPPKSRAVAAYSFIDKINNALEEMGAAELSERETELFEALNRVLKK